MATEAPDEVRIAAVGDLHLDEADDALRVLGELEPCAEEADLLLVAGDLTSHGRPRQAREVARALGQIPLPKLTVLGNHDYDSDRPDAVRALVEEADVRVLEAEAAVVEINGARVGIAGVKGFGGGFRGASASDFGEPEMKAFIRHTKVVAERLERLLADLDTDKKVALLHYSPSEATLAGEPLQLHPFLGSYLLGEAIDCAGADLILHGHSHLGTERGSTAGGIEVRNVARPVLERPYAVYAL